MQFDTGIGNWGFLLVRRLFLHESRATRIDTEGEFVLGCFHSRSTFTYPLVQPPSGEYVGGVPIKHNPLLFFNGSP